jgi:hypothetical protein
LQAIPKILKGGSAIRGLGEGAGAFGEGVSQLDKADAAEKRALASMDFNLKDAQRKERMGLTKEAMTSFTDAQKDKIAADKARLEALKAAVRSTTDAGRAFRAPAAGKPGAGPKLAEINYANILADLKATSQPKEGESPQAFNARLYREASQLAVAQSKTTDVGPEKKGIEDAKIANATDKDIDALVNKNKFTNEDWQNALGNPEKQKQVERDIRNELLGRREAARGGNVNRNSGNNAVPPPPPGFERNPSR